MSDPDDELVTVVPATPGVGFKIPPPPADFIHPMDECSLHPGNRRVDCEHCKASQ